MKKVFLLLFIAFSFAFSETNSTKNELPARDLINIKELNSQIKSINNSLKDNVWQIRYNNFIAYKEIIKSYSKVQEEIKELKISRNTKNKKEILDELQKRKETLEKKRELLSDFKEGPFEQLIAAPKIPDIEKISNPIAVISGFSYIKQLKSSKSVYEQRLASLDKLIKMLEEKEKLLFELLSIRDNEKTKQILEDARYEISEFNAVRDISKITYSVYEKRLEESIHQVRNDITEQIKRAFNIGASILSVIILSFLLKLISKKYIKDNERYYTANKFINIINVSIILIILLFAYIENVTYLVTVLGFASAGIAIAMKDMFMSILGWMVIIFGGSLHVGDRIKVSKEGVVYVGDIIDISLLRITLFEDVTLTTYKENRRSGRVVFVPNNYIFTNLISNYTHMGIKTVWDGIDITISFDSNVKKAMYIVKEITRKYSKGYTDIAKKQVNRLRSQYSLKNTNVEPRVFSFVEPHGLTISAWYMTNSYTALVLRSTLSSEFIEAFNKEDDIQIAYPTQTLYVSKGAKKITQEDNLS